MSDKIQILFVDDEENNCKAFVRLMRLEKEYEVAIALNGLEALESLKKKPADIVITDMKMPEMDGLSLLKEIRERYPDVFVIVVTGHASVENAVKAMKLGAYDYLTKPFDFDVINMILGKISEHARVLKEAEDFEEDAGKPYRFENIIGQDRKMFKIYEMIRAVAKTNASVLITGESGSGKELIAEAIHSRSQRKAKPYHQVNCAALTESIINSELFGHEKGSFTGANQQKIGLFELADQGTLFLDEIGDVPLQIQTSLLRVLEYGTFQRVGGSQTLKVDTRIVCATNRDLSEAIRNKQFREDLFYRINVVSIEVPPLRERKQDIPLLAKYFLEKYARENDVSAKRLAKSAVKILMQYDWPGNVRELGNIINHALIFCKGGNIIPENLPPGIRESAFQREFSLTFTSTSLPKAEESLIRRVIEMNNGNLKQAASDLDIARGTLYSKMQKYGIEKP
ncbi:MAG: sigma-54-dependent Fis family transcriptional regulator [Desulfobacteraceae bacterium]|nr:sigma-54-dependent Fis family transcriptional regulator [Desulfobacteraceae bacterium]MBU4002646.1 sigma-54 dependent transcriptional regulator [Pseudomonadota bacterium]MBU4055255.1 sigma-54 dependent transcriptional regulator [Pseudomonadota bacterium]